jgi:DNA-binding NtrC family response regulator
MLLPHDTINYSMEKEILVIDDDLAILEVIKIILEEKGYKVTTISDSTTVEKYIVGHAPDMIFVDFWMAGLNGRKIVGIVKDNYKTQHVPVIMISANHDVKKISEEIRADGFLAKPFDISDLTTIVDKHI